MEQHFDAVIKSVDEMLADKKIEFHEIVQVLGPTMKLVEELAEPGITGAEKRDFVINLLKTAVEKSPLEDDKKELMVTSCDTVLPPMIDAIIQASKGDFQLNVAPLVTGCFACFASTSSKKA